MLADSIERAAALLRAARATVALTGAGVSTPSGIPDFRSTGGMWEHVDPAEVASLVSFRLNPQRFYDWFRPLLERVLAAAPNPAHQALAVLERRALLQAIVTQNFDGLHQRAGSREVYELHGHIRSATCLYCERRIPAEPLLPRMRRGETPRCSCGHLLKPDVVLFDEMLPSGLYWLARRAVETADVLIVAGTSLEVYPVSELPALARRRGARLIVANTAPTHLDEYADVVVRGDVASTLPAIAERAVGADTLARAS